jgi:hypothetical protein
MNELNETQIKNTLTRHGYKINGIYSKDQLPKDLQEGYYMINMQNHNKGNGTHWTAFRYSKDVCIYYNSFGIQPPIEILNATEGKKLIYNAKQIQDYNSTACGWFCIGVVVYDSKQPFEVHFNRFINLFSNYTRANDLILYNLLRRKGII